MAPHFHPEQPGLPKDSGSDKDGAIYLRRLKGAAACKEGKDPVAREAPKIAAAMAALGLKGRRESARFRCSGSVEFRAEGSEHVFGER